MDLAEMAHLTSAASLPLAIAGAAYVGVRMIILLVAVFGPKKEWADRAMEVLKLMRRDRTSK